MKLNYRDAASDHNNIKQGCTHSDFWGRAYGGYLNWPHARSIILFYTLTMGWTNDLDCRTPNDNGVLSVPLTFSTSWTLRSISLHFTSMHDLMAISKSRQIQKVQAWLVPIWSVEAVNLVHEDDWLGHDPDSSSSFSTTSQYIFIRYSLSIHKWLPLSLIALGTPIFTVLNFYPQ